MLTKNSFYYYYSMGGFKNWLKNNQAKFKIIEECNNINLFNIFIIKYHPRLRYYKKTQIIKRAIL